MKNQINTNKTNTIKKPYNLYSKLPLDLKNNILLFLDTKTYLYIYYPKIYPKLLKVNKEINLSKKKLCSYLFRKYV